MNETWGPISTRLYQESAQTENTEQTVNDAEVQDVDFEDVKN